MNSGNSMYRHHITDTLAKELTNQGSLGLADLIKNWENRLTNKTMLQEKTQ